MIPMKSVIFILMLGALFVFLTGCGEEKVEKSEPVVRKATLPVT